MKIGVPAVRVLDFDCEARPLGWYAGDFTHKEVTAIASAWIDQPRTSIQVSLLGDHSARSMLTAFRQRYDQADLITGHNIRNFDLPLVNAMMVEQGFDPLPPRMTSDTYLDLKRFHGVSKSQENLAGLLGVDAEKRGMSMMDWREANRLTERGLDLVAERAMRDVWQHIELRNTLLDYGMLSAPKVWYP